MVDQRPHIFATHHLGILRGAAWVAVLALLVGVAEWVADALVMQYTIDISSMWLFVVGGALFAGSQAFLNSSVRVVIEEKGIRISQGLELLTGRSKLILWDWIYVANIISPPRHRSWLHRLIYRNREDILSLQHRLPRRKLVAAFSGIPLGGLENVEDLAREIEKHADVQWKVSQGGVFDQKKNINFHDVPRILAQIETKDRTDLLPPASGNEDPDTVSS